MSADAETIVLVHGLWLHGVAFAVQRQRLMRQGFAVRTFSYPSVRRNLAGNAEALAQFLRRIETARIHLVGHSLGGLIVLEMLARHPDPRIGRAVLMGSPCLGSHCAEVLRRVPGLAPILGRSIGEWLARPCPRIRGKVAIGVLAGSRRFGLGLVIPGLPRPNDGVVAVAETRLPGALDSITLPIAHSEMLVSRACIEQVTAFLRTGSFSHA